MISGDRLPTLTAQRVRLRWLTDADAESLYAVFSHQTVMRYWSTAPMSSSNALANAAAQRAS